MCTGNCQYLLDNIRVIFVVVVNLILLRVLYIIFIYVYLCTFVLGVLVAKSGAQNFCFYAIFSASDFGAMMSTEKVLSV